MKRERRKTWIWWTAGGAAAGVVTVLLALSNHTTPLSGQPALGASEDGSSVFSPAHRSLGEAIRHFMGWRPDPEQPIEFPHRIHAEEVGLRCDFCHDGVTVGPVANIPSIEVCMICHSEIATDRPAIEMLQSYWDNGQEPPWQRVYGWPPEDHVRFNHASHIRADVSCTTCHGDVAEMTVAERVMEHSMGFCMNCHEQEAASTECTTCHY